MVIQVPPLNTWFHDLEQGTLFETVAIDEARGTIEVQYLDGNIDNFDLETWAQLSLAPAEPPEDYSQALELDPEDRWYDDASTPPFPAINPLSLIEPASLMDLEDYY